MRSADGCAGPSPDRVVVTAGGKVTQWDVLRIGAAASLVTFRVTCVAISCEAAVSRPLRAAGSLTVPRPAGHGRRARRTGPRPALTHLIRLGHVGIL